MKPRICWFSPLPPDRTDIANYTVRLLPALTAMFHVELWTETAMSDETRQSLHERGAEVVSFQRDAIAWQRLNYADAVVYNVGNDARFHRGIVMAAQRHPGIVIQHDPVIHELVAGVHQPKQYIDVLRRIHGPEAGEAGTARLRGEAGAMSIGELADRWPLFGYTTENALAVITHNAHWVERMQARTPLGKVTYLPIPYLPAKEIAAQMRRVGDVSGRPVRLLLFGFLGQNRRLYSALEAVATHPQRDRFELHIAGTSPDEEAFWREAHRLNFADRVQWRGFVEEDMLQYLLNSSDLTFNLRWPSKGEASGSQMRIWNHCLPSLNTPVGWYAQQPPATMNMVREDHEIEDIQHHLTAFLAAPADYYQRAVKGWEHLRAVHTAEKFVAGLGRVIAGAQNVMGTVAGRKLRHRVRQELAAWGGTS